MATPTPAPVRVALVGYGFGGRFFHAPLIAAAPECELVGVVTTSPERRQDVARDLPAATVFDALGDVVAAGVEAVAISTPAATHSALTDAALELGLAVVCDKPFSLDAAAARASVERAAASGLALSPYQNRRWDSDFLTVRRLLDEGAVGRVLRLESHFERYSPEPGPPASGGGTLRDFLSHLVDQALVLFGPVETVYAEWQLRDGGLDDDVFVALQHASGVRSHLRGSWVQGAPDLRFRLTGSAGSYVVDGMDVQESQLLAGHSPATLGSAWGQEPESAWGSLRRGPTSEPVPSERGRWDAFYPAFAAAVRGEGPVPVDPWDAVRTATVLDAARRSAESGRLVVLDGR